MVHNTHDSLEKEHNQYLQLKPTYTEKKGGDKKLMLEIIQPTTASFNKINFAVQFS